MYIHIHRCGSDTAESKSVAPAASFSRKKKTKKKFGCRAWASLLPHHHLLPHKKRNCSRTPRLYFWRGEVKLWHAALFLRFLLFIHAFFLSILIPSRSSSHRCTTPLERHTHARTHAPTHTTAGSRAIDTAAERRRQRLAHYATQHTNTHTRTRKHVRTYKEDSSGSFRNASPAPRTFPHSPIPVLSLLFPILPSLLSFCPDPCPPAAAPHSLAARVSNKSKATDRAAPACCVR